MPDLEIAIPYRSPLLTSARVITLLAFPLWGFFAPMQILFGVIQFIFYMPAVLHSSLGSIESLIWVLISPLTSFAFSCTLMYLGIRSVVLLGDKSITMSDKGISFPANFLPGMKFKRHRKWSDLGKIEVENLQKLDFKFLSGGAATIKLSALNHEQKEKLLLGLNAWAKNLDTDQKIAGLLEGLQDQAIGTSSTSYTKLWEEQMNSHFASTAFVPLAQDTLLQSGRVKVIGPIAFGGLSAVYLAQLKSTETVILKELVTDDVSDNAVLQKSIEMFQREAEILMQLDDPRIAKVLDHFSENGRNYLLLEHIHGENLRNVITQSGPRSEAQALDWAKQITSILAYIHGREPAIIHRDLTPDNLVLRDGRQIVLIDFGAANTFLGTATGTLVGKQSYISPEQFRGKPIVQSDIYSLGASLYFLLTGQEPEPLSQSDPRELRPEVSEGFANLVLACTAFDPSKRPASALELLSLLDSLSPADAPRRLEVQS